MRWRPCKRVWGARTHIKVAVDLAGQAPAQPMLFFVSYPGHSRLGSKDSGQLMPPLIGTSLLQNVLDHCLKASQERSHKQPATGRVIQTCSPYRAGTAKATLVSGSLNSYLRRKLARVSCRRSPRDVSPRCCGCSGATLHNYDDELPPARA